MGQHVLQPTQRQDRLPTEVQEDLRTERLVRPFEAIVEQTFVDQADELGAEVGVIDRSLHVGLRSVPGSPAAASQQLAEDGVDRRIADRDQSLKDVQCPGDGIGALGCAGAEQQTATLREHRDRGGASRRGSAGTEPSDEARQWSG